MTIEIANKKIRLASKEHAYKLIHNGPTELSWGAYGLSYFLITCYHTSIDDLNLERINQETGQKKHFFKYINELIQSGFLIISEEEKINSLFRKDKEEYKEISPFSFRDKKSPKTWYPSEQ